ncbi:hypothetical protein NQZ68_020894, partial [Dissostichus eleginoides]
RKWISYGTSSIMLEKALFVTKLKKWLLCCPFRHEAILQSLGLTVVQMHSHLPADITEKALHWWCPSPTVESTLGGGPGACWTFLGP